MTRLFAIIPIAGMAALAACSSPKQPTAPAVTVPITSARTVDYHDAHIVPTVVDQVTPDYPSELRSRRIEGSALVDYVVGIDGAVHDAKLVRATQPAFGEAALAAVRKWKYRPAIFNQQPVNCRMQAPMDFVLSTARSAATMAGDAEAGDGPDVYTIDQVQKRPRPIKRSPPVYPSRLRESGKVGEAVISFIVTKSGTVAGARIESASDTAFGEAALESINSWQFEPAYRNGQPVDCRMRLPVVFSYRNN